MRPEPLAIVALALLAAGPAAGSGVDECISAAAGGQLARDEGHYLRARQAFTACASASCPTAIRTECVKWLDDVEAGIPTVVFVARDAAGADLADVVVRMDGAVVATHLDGKPIAVDPGEHVVAFEAGARRVEEHVIVHAGERNRTLYANLGGAPVADKARREVPLAPAILGGASVIAIATSLVLWSSARSDLTSLEANPCATTKTCNASDVRSVRTRLILGDVLLGVGLAAGGAALWIWLTERRNVAAFARGTVVGLDARF